MDDLNLFIALNRTLLYLDRETVKIFRSHGLTKGQFAVLEALYHKGELTSKEIKELILMTPGNLPVIIRNLERDNFITRREDEEDRRYHPLSLTEKGRQKIEEVFPENEKKIRECFSVWNDEEKREMMKLFLKFRKKYFNGDKKGE